MCARVLVCALSLRVIYVRVCMCLSVCGGGGGGEKFGVGVEEH